MYLIVGLGNPDKKYMDTFHNVGFMCVDALAKRLGVDFDKKECEAVTSHTRVAGNKVIIAKPLTYMNLSGNAVAKLIAKYKVPLVNCIVVYDDIDLPIGDIRIRISGSAGTHNGMRSVVSNIGSTQLQRIRVGIYRATPMALVDYVLSRLQTDDKIVLDNASDKVACALHDFVSGVDIDKVMRTYNVKTAQ